MDKFGTQTRELHSYYQKLTKDLGGRSCPGSLCHPIPSSPCGCIRVFSVSESPDSRGFDQGDSWGMANAVTSLCWEKSSKLPGKLKTWEIALQMHDFGRCFHSFLIFLGPHDALWLTSPDDYIMASILLASGSHLAVTTLAKYRMTRARKSVFPLNTTGVEVSPTKLLS